MSYDDASFDESIIRDSIQKIDLEPIYLNEQYTSSIKALRGKAAVSDTSFRGILQYIESTAGDLAEYNISVNRLEKKLARLIDLHSILKSEPDALQIAVDADQDGRDPAEAYEYAIREVEDDLLQQSDLAKYSTHPNFINFKRVIWESQFNDEDMPAIEDWFDENGQSMSINEIKERQQNNSDDLVVAQERRSFKCPISLTVLRDPVTSTVCKHSYSREPLTELIVNTARRRTGTIECPVAGCNKMISLEKVRPDTALARRVDRYLSQQTQDESFDQIY
ncbi:zinc-finger of the MIZ type in Nse subunit-domain-containing protein [Dipodascopsis uninucleata]